MKKITSKVKFPLHLYIPTTQSKTPQSYELFGITKHIGTLNSGHYVAFVKREKGKWYLFNDEIVQNVDEEDVLA
jgi:ubiquitin C-terminal hydrolase